jgi:hypothetical protein
VVLCYYLCSCGESRLLFSWCVGDRCDMTGNDEDHGMSRRPGAEDRSRSDTGQVLGDRKRGALGPFWDIGQVLLRNFD